LHSNFAVFESEKENPGLTNITWLASWTYGFTRLNWQSESLDSLG